MKTFSEMSQKELEPMYQETLSRYNEFRAKNLKLDMSRGKPAPEQLTLSDKMLDAVKAGDNMKSQDGIDTRNYGNFDGIPECRELFAQMLGVSLQEVFVGGNSSLSLMYDTLSRFMLYPVHEGCTPWCKLDKVKFLCPAPGYDRHFAITEHLGMELIPVAMTKAGPDMDAVEQLVAKDDSIKGIWCVPKYSNPQGITYSDETVKRLAHMKTAAKDFIIMWDNAYGIHDLDANNKDELANIMDACKAAGNPNRVVLFASTSKVSYAGAGVAAFAAAPELMAAMKKHIAFQTIGHDKVNMLRHVRFYKNLEGMQAHMEKHAEILQPKFQAVLDGFDKELAGKGIASWVAPKGGYFISLDVMPGCAKRVVSLCKEGGVVLTPAGATYPYGKDPQDSNIRVAPTFPSVNELVQAVELLCISTQLAALEKLLHM